MELQHKHAISIFITGRMLQDNSIGLTYQKNPFNS